MGGVALMRQRADQPAGQGHRQDHAEGQQPSAAGPSAGGAEDRQAVVNCSQDHHRVPIAEAGGTPAGAANARLAWPFPKPLGGSPPRAHLPSMIRPALLALAILAAPLHVAAQNPGAQNPGAQNPGAMTPQALQGQTVRGAKGVVLGTVERVTTAPDGRAAQILVRPKGLHPGGARSLAVAGVVLGPDGVSTPITKAEFDAMPAVDLGDR